MGPARCRDQDSLRRADVLPLHDQHVARSIPQNKVQDGAQRRLTGTARSPPACHDQVHAFLVSGVQNTLGDGPSDPRHCLDGQVLPVRLCQRLLQDRLAGLRPQATCFQWHRFRDDHDLQCQYLSTVSFRQLTRQTQQSPRCGRIGDGYQYAVGDGAALLL